MSGMGGWRPSMDCSKRNNTYWKTLIKHGAEKLGESFLSAVYEHKTPSPNILSGCRRVFAEERSLSLGQPADLLFTKYTRTVYCAYEPHGTVAYI